MLVIARECPANPRFEYISPKDHWHGTPWPPQSALGHKAIINPSNSLIEPLIWYQFLYMPRLAPSLFRRASRTSPRLSTLLPACRDIASAQNELRWIREHVRSTPWTTSVSEDTRIAHLCRLRGRGVPLQYVLGSQPFGPLDIRCRPGVLVPRPETEAYVAHLANLLRQGRLPIDLRRIPASRDEKNVPDDAKDGGPTHRPLNIVDVCTGTGCIALLLSSFLHRYFPKQTITARGLDISRHAVVLARANLALAQEQRHLPTDDRVDIQLAQADVFHPSFQEKITHPVDILISNPPYISARGFHRSTSRSVRNHEPRLALVPREGLYSDGLNEDAFYRRLIEVGASARARVMLFEVGDMEQAVRVASMALDRTIGGKRVWEKVEIWRDIPDAEADVGEETDVTINNRHVPLCGTGDGRAVLLHRAGAAS